MLTAECITDQEMVDGIRLEANPIVDKIRCSRKPIDPQAYLADDDDAERTLLDLLSALDGTTDPVTAANLGEAIRFLGRSREATLMECLQRPVLGSDARIDLARICSGLSDFAWPVLAEIAGREEEDLDLRLACIEELEGHSQAAPRLQALLARTSEEEVRAALERVLSGLPTAQ